jgi:hypothetical protein
MQFSRPREPKGGASQIKAGEAGPVSGATIGRRHCTWATTRLRSEPPETEALRVVTRN